MDFDTLLTKVGEFGRFQKFLFFFQAPFSVIVTFVLFGQLFIMRYPDAYWCAGNATDLACHTVQGAQWASLSGPANNPCLKYRIESELDRRAFRSLLVEICRDENNIEVQCDWSGVSVRSRTVRQYNRYPGSNYGASGRRVVVPTSKPLLKNHSKTSPTVRSTIGQSPSAPVTIVTPDLEDTTTRASASSRGHVQSCSSRWWPPTCLSINQAPLSYHPNATLNTSLLLNWGTCTCRKFQHDKNAFPYTTIVTEANYWCDTLPNWTVEEKLTLASSIFYIGAIVGGFVVGGIADSFGRVPALIAANIVGFIGGVVTLISTNFWVFCVSRFISGMAFDNCFVMIYILVLEYVGPSYRTLVANLSIAIFYTAGTLLVPVIFELTQHWKVFGWITTIPMLLCIVAYFVLPESARWLLSRGRAKEATDILRKFAVRNGQVVEEKDFQDFRKTSEEIYAETLNEEEVSLFRALKRPRILKNFVLLVLIWSIIALIYDGHSRNVLNLGGNFSLMFAVASLTELPADLLLVFVLDYFGRRWLAFASLGLSAAFSILSTIPDISSNNAAFLGFAITSRFWVNVAFNIGLQWAAELLPTVIRAQGVNFIHIMGYVASIISPLIASVGRSNRDLSLIILGGLSLAAAMLSLFLPETLGEDLPNTLEDGESFGAKQSFWKCPACSNIEEEMEPLAPEEEDDLPKVVLRNKIRSSIRGEAYRSSILSQLGGTALNYRRISRKRGESVKLRRLYTQ